MLVYLLLKPTDGLRDSSLSRFLSCHYFLEILNFVMKKKGYSARLYDTEKCSNTIKGKDRLL